MVKPMENLITLCKKHRMKLILVGTVIVTAIIML